MSRLTSLASATLIAAIASGCAAEKVPVTNLGPFEPIRYSCVDTTDTRKAIRKHNSTYDSLKSGKKVIYADDCPKEEASKPTS